MAFGDWATLLSNFTGANQNPLSEGGNWANLDTAHGNALQRISNAVGCTASTTGESYWTPADIGADVEAYLTMPTLPGNGNNISISARVLQAGGNATYDGYRVRMNQVAGSNNDALDICRVDNAVVTSLASFASRDFVAGEKIGIRCIGSTVQAWYYSGGVWTLAAQATDTTYSATGKVAIHLRGTTGRLDDVFAGVVGAEFVPTAICY